MTKGNLKVGTVVSFERNFVKGTGIIYQIDGGGYAAQVFETDDVGRRYLHSCNGTLPTKDGYYIEDNDITKVVDDKRVEGLFE